MDGNEVKKDKASEYKFFVNGSQKKIRIGGIIQIHLPDTLMLSIL
jgi:hypothetical protein